MSSATKRKSWQQPGAFGNITKRQKFLAEAARGLTEASRQRQLKRTYRDFYESDEGKKFLAMTGMTEAFQDSAPRTGASSDPDFHDPAELPQASFSDHPVDHIEPQDEHAKFFGLARGAIDEITEAFRDVFRWCLDGGASCRNGVNPLVEIGVRCNVVIYRMRPDLARKLDFHPSLLKKFDKAFKKDSLCKSGEWHGYVLEWLRRGDTVSARGERINDLAYHLWPDDIEAMTLAELGELNGKTRQAKDKKANDFRDTMGGLRAQTMRPDITRDRCRFSQLSRTK